MSTLEECPMGNGDVTTVDDGYECQECGRVWYELSEGQWASRKRRVRLKKRPEKGDAMDDVIEPA